MQTKTPYIPTREQKSAVPLGNFDIHEDERKSRIKPGLFAFLLAERIIFGKKTQKQRGKPCAYLSVFC